jgi:hypothetical protein
VARENGAMWMQLCLPNHARIKGSFGDVTKRNDKRCRGVEDSSHM